MVFDKIFLRNHVEIHFSFLAKKQEKLHTTTCKWLTTNNSLFHQMLKQLQKITDQMEREIAYDNCKKHWSDGERNCIRQLAMVNQ